MTISGVWILLVTVAILAWLLTGWLRKYALARQLVDVPNARSSHQVAMPRGGGAAIVAAATMALAGWSWGTGSMTLAWSLAGGLIVAAVGFLDDHRPLPALFRLVCHSAAAMLAAVSLGGLSLGVLWVVPVVVFVTWLTNLTNFMDGIDGLAAAEAVTVCAVGAALFAFVFPGTGRWVEAAILAAAAAGFLVWNWPPARIFMGDVGSGYLGFMIGVMTLRAALVAPALGWSWLILSGGFVVDASVTLVRRAIRRDRLFEAHRSHAYQHLAIAWGSHRPVTLLMIAINLCWLMPWAALVAANVVTGATGLLLAYLPLVIGTVWLGAGTGSRP